MIYISEIFDEFETAKRKQDKITVLQKYKKNITLYNILKGTFHPDIKFIKIPKKFKYNESDLPYGNTDTTLDYESKHFWYYIDSHDKLSQEIRMQKLLIMLESLHAGEAKILLGMINKKLKVKGLTKSIVKEVFPEFFPEKQKQ